MFTRKMREEISNTRNHIKITLASPASAYWGELCAASEHGTFMKRLKCFTTGTSVDIEIVMPDLSHCQLKGTGRSARELAMPDKRFGIDVEIAGAAMSYGHVMKFVDDKSSDCLPEAILSDDDMPWEVRRTNAP